MVRTPLPALLALLLLPATPAAACSVVSSYRVPTSLQLAERADTILIGTVDGEEPGASDFDGKVLIHPTTLLKGAALPGEVKMFGYIAEAPMRAPISDPRELRAPNPGALTGGCTRYVFGRGMRVVLFFERSEDGTLQFAGYPFARVAEDVPSNDALWVKAVRLYVEVAKLAADARRAALVARRDELRAQSGDADAQALAADIDIELAGSSREARD